jgi:hypothetical protein
MVKPSTNPMAINTNVLSSIGRRRIKAMYKKQKAESNKTRFLNTST